MSYANLCCSAPDTGSVQKAAAIRRVVPRDSARAPCAERAARWEQVWCPVRCNQLGAAVGWIAAHRLLRSVRAVTDLLATLEAEDGFNL